MTTELLVESDQPSQVRHVKAAVVGVLQTNSEPQIGTVDNGALRLASVVLGRSVANAYVPARPRRQPQSARCEAALRLLGAPTQSDKAAHLRLVESILQALLSTSPRQERVGLFASPIHF